ncbi:hypothetical protein PGT21_029691 [Puccinia graminis f. sp. tritici]|uniref:HAT C-terminal dimerisation domain-containing protein n=1 Tax=Puccinia graminis f. sp. tritici TaxID=56615 RepID=A0A5B0QQ37_PUCGR|nr:hypothetical protein PGT21_029691 [Puccinia graminis f. sp. tritici]
MASTMCSMINSYGSAGTPKSKWDPSTMHIRCFCHKIALIVNAGLAALSLKTLPPGKTKESVLGFFPVLGRLTEEQETEGTLPVPLQAQGNEIDVVQAGPVDNTVNEYNPCDFESDYGNADEECSEVDGEQDGDDIDSDSEDANSKAQSAKTKHVKSTRLLELTQKVQLFHLDLLEDDVVVAGARLGQSFGRFVWGMRNARGADAESTRS